MAGLALKRDSAVPAIKERRAVRVKGAKAASDEQLALINGWALEELKADDVYVRTFYVAHNAIDRDLEVFSADVLEDFAKTLPGKGFFVIHPNHHKGDPGPGEGLWFQARTVRMSQSEARAALGEPELQWLNDSDEAVLLEASAYLPKTSENETLRIKLDSGIARYVSIGFGYAELDPVFVNDELVAAIYRAPAEASEASLVWLGAQPGARVIKSFNREEDSDMKLEEQLKQLEQKLSAKDTELSQLQSKAEAGEKASKTLEAIAKAAGDEKAGPDRLVALVESGKQYEDELVSKAVRLQRLAKQIGDSDADAKKAAEFHRKNGVAHTKQYVEMLEKTVKDTGEGSIEGADPNATEASKGDDDLRDDSQTKAAVGG
ncbi:hypothetical protein [Natronospira bacteriovora]|uniref:Uncharacterized protein n=1 Tax=Natronospira bacteriovora TaxID=3069753 RepID=A0ABU0W5M8_9GAMM|nr:hypothetical protein [Natronospira sp. AB-CW4]MDQ2069324.1 hypothetical protein [Natronospira sp. AB-CW4]